MKDGKSLLEEFGGAPGKLIPREKPVKEIDKDAIIEDLRVRLAYVTDLHGSACKQFATERSALENTLRKFKKGKKK